MDALLFSIFLFGKMTVILKNLLPNGMDFHFVREKKINLLDEKALSGHT